MQSTELQPTSDTEPEQIAVEERFRVNDRRRRLCAAVDSDIDNSRTSGCLRHEPHSYQQLSHELGRELSATRTTALVGAAHHPKRQCTARPPTSDVSPRGSDRCRKYIRKYKSTVVYLFKYLHCVVIFGRTVPDNPPVGGPFHVVTAGSVSPRPGGRGT